MTTTMIRSGLVAGMAAALGLASPAQAQDDGWFAYLGCWAPESGAGPTVCIRPTLDGAELARIADGRVVTREAYSMGEPPARSQREGCEGEHRATLSEDGHRVFVTSDYVCEGGNTRHETAILALAAPDQLLDVRSVDVEGEAMAWVQWYRAAPMSVGQEAGIADLPVPGMALETARRAAARSLHPDDVVEAVEVVGVGATEAWVAETGDRFDLDAETLVALSDRGVPPEVLDLMIAVSYPDRFALAVDEGGAYAEPMEGVSGGPGRGMSPWWGGARFGFYNPFFFDPFFFDPFGYRLSRYSFGPWGWGGGWYGRYDPGIIVVRDGSGSSRGGRVVPGRGYTRGGSGSAAAPRTPARTRGGTTRGPATTTRRNPGSSPAVGRSGGTTRTPARGGTVRRAKPRGGGGGGLL